IKIPHPEMESDPVFFDRFQREHDIGTKLDHPGVMKVMADDDRSQLYMVMEWVEGRLLRQLLNEQKVLPPDRAVKITLGIAYALGVMLYEMLTGKVPFQGPNPFAIMNDRLLNNPVPPREVNPEISPQLQEVIYRALERDPRKRYANAHEFAWDLEHQDQVGVA